jgi:diadenosine tetraphosphate (Ap4A) HIT family hydrolase
VAACGGGLCRELDVDSGVLRQDTGEGAGVLLVAGGTGEARCGPPKAAFVPVAVKASPVKLDAARVFFRRNLVVGLWDAFPASRGHALVITCRHIDSWFNATLSEQQELLEAIAAAREAILASYQPQGFNIGVNIGAAAGQTVFHLHVHIIPRYEGDVPDPRGGVRNVIASKGNYLRKLTPVPAAFDRLPHGRALITGNESDPLLPHLVSHLDQAVGLDMAVAFIMPSGVDRLYGHFQDLLARGGRLRLLTGDYLGITDPRGLQLLLDLQGLIELRIFESGAQILHPKSPLSG